jgi:hypothetical protein
MADQWYYATGERRFGPFSARQLRALAASGKILPTDTIWKAGIEKGVPASKVKNLFPPVHSVALPGNSSAPLAQSSSQPSPITPPSGNLTPVALPDSSPPSLVSPPTPVMLRLGNRPEASTTDETIAQSEPVTAISSGDTAIKPHEKSHATLSQPGSQQERSMPKRLVRVQGAVIVAQDDTTIKYRMKCTVCRYEHHRVTTMTIRNGLTTVSFFCPTCLERREVQIEGSTKWPPTR